MVDGASPDSNQPREFVVALDGENAAPCSVGNADHRSTGTVNRPRPVVVSRCLVFASVSSRVKMVAVLQGERETCEKQDESMA